MRQTRLYTATLSVALLLLLSLVTTASAHKVTIFAYVEGGKVYTESYYVDGTKCKNSEIEVYDKNGKKVLTGKTNDKGEFAFTPPCEGPLKLVLNASMGHRAETTVSKEDLMEGGAALSKETNNQESENTEVSSVSSSKSKEITITREELQKILNETLDKKLHPIMKLIAESREHGVSAKDVFAGLGYIFGLMGLAIYIKDIKKQGRKEQK